MPNPAPNPDLPAPTPELILLGVLTRAYMRRLQKGERMLFLEDVTTALDDLASGRNVHRIRPRSEDGNLRSASLAAQTWWSQLLGVLISGRGV
jgi:hypothetical protein